MNEDNILYETKNQQDNIVLVGFDKSTDIIGGIESGAIKAVMVQSPESMGSIGVKTIVDYLNDGKMLDEKQVDTGVTVVDKSNLDLIK